MFLPLFAMFPGKISAIAGDFEVLAARQEEVGLRGYGAGSGRKIFVGWRIGPPVVGRRSAGQSSLRRPAGWGGDWRRGG